MKKKYPETFFESSGGEGPLYVYFSKGPYGNAVDDESGKGAGFFSENGELIGVLFDRVNESSDAQTLKFSKNRSVTIRVKNKKIIEVTLVSPKKAA
jgi:hypothetical protein